MLTARYAGDRKISIDHTEASPPAANEVQVRVAYTGMCGTDLHILHGDMDARVTTPARLRPRDERRRSPPSAPDVDGVGGRRRRHRDAAGLGRHLPRLPGRQPAHLPEPRTSSASTPPARCSSSGTSPPTSGRACPQACASTTRPSSSPSPWRCTTCAGRELVAGRPCRRDRRRADRRAHRDASRAQSGGRGRGHRARRRRAARRSTSWGSRRIDPRGDRSGRLGRGVDRRCRRGRRLRGVGRRRRPCSGPRPSPRCGARSWSSPSIPRRARSTCSGCSGASCRILGARVYQRADFETAVELLAGGRHPGRRC